MRCRHDELADVKRKAASLLREARTRAGLTQRELAKRARTAQSVVARIEQGQSDPSWETLARLVAAAGCDLHEERLAEVRNVDVFLTAAQRRG